MRKYSIFIFLLTLVQPSHADIYMSLSDAIRLAQEHSLDAKMARFSFLSNSITLSVSQNIVQPLRAFNALKWRGKSEPVAYGIKELILNTISN